MIARSLLHRGSLFNAKSSKSMAPPFPAAISRVTSNRERFGECGELYFGVYRRRRSIQDRVQRAPRVWAGGNVELIAVVPSVPVVVSEQRVSSSSVIQLVVIIEIGGLNVFLASGLGRHRIRRVEGPPSFGHWQFLRPPRVWV